MVKPAINDWRCEERSSWLPIVEVRRLQYFGCVTDRAEQCPDGGDS
ncbi:MAG: hypothetical protein KAT07_11105 [Calditrichia bacterium]|nr:hypothetical protein [Calditrichia bacterium]